MLVVPVADLVNVGSHVLSSHEGDQEDQENDKRGQVDKEEGFTEQWVVLFDETDDEHGEQDGRLDDSHDVHELNREKEVKCLDHGNEDDSAYYGEAAAALVAPVVSLAHAHSYYYLLQ